jgi:hypothetical protein
MNSDGAGFVDHMLEMHIAYSDSKKWKYTCPYSGESFNNKKSFCKYVTQAPEYHCYIP